MTVETTNGAFAKRWLTFVVMTFGALQPSCGGRDEHPSTSISEGLANGYTSQASGVVHIQSPHEAGGLLRNCTGTLLTGDWVLTAKHCLRAGAARPSSIKVYLRGSKRQAKRVKLHPSVDAALIELNEALLDGNLAFSTPLYYGSNDSLVGRTLSCYGYGGATVPQPNAPVASAKTQLRVGYLTVSSASSQGYWMKPNASGQIIVWGDSGGPCFAYRDGKRYLTGIHSDLDATVTDTRTTIHKAFDLGAEFIRAWVHGSIGAGAAAYQHSSYRGKAQELLIGGYWDGTSLTVGNDRISSLHVPKWWRVTAFQHHRYIGYAQSFYSDTPHVGVLNDHISSLYVTGGPNIWAGKNQLGSRRELSEGHYTRLDSGFDRKISSLCVPANWRVTLFDQPDLNGRMVTFHGGCHRNVGSYIDNRASSIRVERPLVIYQGANHTGRSAMLWPGWYTTRELGIRDNGLASLRLPLGWGVVFYEHPDFKGSRWVSESGHLPSGAQGRVSSIQVYRRN